MKVSAAIAEILKREGVDILFGLPPATPCWRAAAEADIRTVIVRQERTGLHMADAYSRMTRGKKMGVFAMQHGPGTENAYGGVAQAWSESIPLLVLPQGYARRLAFVPDNYNASVQMASISKSAEPIMIPAEDGEHPAPRLHQHAQTAARARRSSRSPTTSRTRRCRSPSTTSRLCAPASPPRRTPSPRRLMALVKAERPVIYAGQGRPLGRGPTSSCASSPNCWPRRCARAWRARAPSTRPIPWRSAPVGAATPAPLRHFLDRSDVIFAVGASLSQTAFGVQMPRGKTVIHNTLDERDINKVLPTRHAPPRRRQADPADADRRLPGPDHLAARPVRRPGRDQVGRGRVDEDLAADPGVRRGAAHPLPRAVGAAADRRQGTTSSSPTTPARRATS
ncbi:MAG: thiamine pyrophosphate-binding protein [Caulobacteraceae bacterium]